MGITPKPDRDTAQVIQSLLRRITALEQATTISLKSPNFDGSLDPAEAGTQGWALGGPLGVAVLNDLILRPGSIDNSILTNPVAPQAVNGVASGYGLTTTVANVGTLTVNVPVGFTQCLAMAVMNFLVYNTNGSGASYVQGNCVFPGFVTGGAETEMYCEAGIARSFTNSNSALLTGLTGGGTFTAVAQENVGTGSPSIPATSLTGVNMSLLALFLR